MIIAWDLLPTRFVDNKSCWSLTTRNVELYNNIWIKYSYILYKSSNATYMSIRVECGGGVGGKRKDRVWWGEGLGDRRCQWCPQPRLTTASLTESQMMMRRRGRMMSHWWHKCVRHEFPFHPAQPCFQLASHWQHFWTLRVPFLVILGYGPWDKKTDRESKKNYFYANLASLLWVAKILWHTKHRVYPIRAIFKNFQRYKALRKLQFLCSEFISWKSKSMLIHV